MNQWTRLSQCVVLSGLVSMNHCTRLSQYVAFAQFDMNQWPRLSQYEAFVQFDMNQWPILSQYLAYVHFDINQWDASPVALTVEGPR